MRRLTASRAQLAIKCSFWLHDHVEVLDSPPGPWAIEGTALHSMIEADLLGMNPTPALDELQGDVDAIERVTRKFRAWQAWAVKERHVGWRPEVAFAYDHRSDSARELAAKHHRDYSDARPGELTMQLDVVTMGEDAEGPFAEVIDWKSGQDSAYAAAQLGVGALAWCRVTGVERARVRAVYVGEESVHEHTAWLSAFDLDMVRWNVRRVLETPDPEPRPGGHCSALYCGARHACPATIADTAALAKVPEEDVRDLVATAIQTPAQAAHAYVRLKVIEDAVDAVKTQIRKVVSRSGGGVPLDNGHVLKLVETTTEHFSKARLPKDRAEDVLAELRSLGAISTSTRTYMRQVKQ